MRLLFRIILVAMPSLALADAPEIKHVNMVKNGGSWQVSVTLLHPDTGWEHYADGWEVLTLDGERLGFRELLHPHVNEQPFTRSLGGVEIPTGTQSVNVRAKCSVDGWSSELFQVDLR